MKRNIEQKAPDPGRNLGITKLLSHPVPRIALAFFLGYPDYKIRAAIRGEKQFPELEKILGIWKRE